MPDGLQDPEVLSLCVFDGRILVSHDVHTMDIHFAAMEGPRPGVFLISQKVSIGKSIEQIVLIWNTTETDEWWGKITWLPL